MPFGSGSSVKVNIFKKLKEMHVLVAWRLGFRSVEVRVLINEKGICCRGPLQLSFRSVRVKVLKNN